MRKIRKAFVSTLLTSLAVTAMTVAHAGSGTGRIIYFVSFMVGNEEAIVVRLDSMSIAACAAGGSANRFVLTSADKRFKTITAMLMGAYHADTAVRIHGTGSCTLYQGAEDLAYACLGSDPC